MYVIRYYDSGNVAHGQYLGGVHTVSGPYFVPDKSDAKPFDDAAEAQGYIDRMIVGRCRRPDFFKPVPREL